MLDSRRVVVSVDHLEELKHVLEPGAVPELQVALASPVEAPKRSTPLAAVDVLSRLAEVSFRSRSHAKRTYRFRHGPVPLRAVLRATFEGMEEAQNVLERLRRIDALQREQAPAAALLAEVRELVTEAEAWLELEPAGARTKTALERCREALGGCPALPP